MALYGDGAANQVGFLPFLILYIVFMNNIFDMILAGPGV